MSSSSHDDDEHDTIVKRQLINDSLLETVFTERVVMPIERIVPAVFRPNHITMLNAISVWAAFLLATQITQHGEEHHFPLSNFILRILVGFSVFCSLTLDCLDGVMARKRGQCSDLGEILDHGGDSFNVPAIASTWLLSVGTDRTVYAISQLGVSMIYNSQIVLYRLTSKMMQPPTNGVEAEFTLVIAHVVLAIVYEWAPPEYLAVLPWIVGVPSNIVQLLDWWYLYKILRTHDSKDADLHAYFIMSSIPLVILHIFNVTSNFMFMMLFGFVCFRLTGTVVLYTVTEKRKKKPFEKSDYLRKMFYNLWVWEALICLSACFLSPEMTNLFCWGCVLTMIMLVWLDFNVCSPFITRVKSE